MPSLAKLTAKDLVSAVPLQLPVTSGDPKATSNINLGVNLPAAADVVTSRPEFADGYVFNAEDPNRDPFSEPDPVLREEKVKSQRKQLLNQVIEAGHPVDKVVTADTRREFVYLEPFMVRPVGFVQFLVRDGLNYQFMNG